MPLEKVHVNPNITNNIVIDDIDYIQDNKLIIGSSPRCVMVGSENDLDDLDDYTPGSVAYTAGYSNMWQLDASGEWVSIGDGIDPATIEQAVADWLDDHPEATTTVQDGAISYSKLDATLKGKVDDVDELKNALQATDAKVETLNALELEQKTVSGSEAVFEDGTGANADEVIAEIAPTQSGTGDPSLSNVRTINGWTGASVYVGAEAGTADETYSVDWETEAGTVYNGTINFTTGELTSNWVIRDISDMGVTKSSGSSEPWLHRFSLLYWDSTLGGYDRRKGKTNLLSDVLKVDTAANIDGTMVGDNGYPQIYVYDSTVSTAQEFKNKYAGHYIAYEINPALAKTYNLQPTTVATLSGENHIWANTGDVSVTYSNSKLTAAIEAINEDIQGLSESINGTPEEETAVKVSGINFAENATKYVSGGSYETWYFPVTTGDEFCFEIGTTAADGFEIRFAIASDIPAANIPGKYITKKTCSGKNSIKYEGIADADGYLTASWWTATGRTAYAVTVTSGGVSQRINSVEADINKLYEQEQRIDDINSELSDMKGQTVQLEAGTYWGANTVGSSLESQIQTGTGASKRTVITLPANTVLRIMGAGLSELTRLYWVFRASDGLLIDISDWHDQASPRAYYLKYDVETHIYINCANAYEHFVGVVDDIGPFVDISKSIGTTTRKIIDFDERNIRYAVRNMKRRSNSASYDPVLFLHFSDIHGDTENLSRLMEFASDYHIGHYLNDILCTGDIVKATLDDGMAWFDTVSGTNKILLLPGNHDSVKGSSASPTSATKQEMYEALFADRVSNWGVTQPEGASTNYLGYYYKDYATQKLRLICLDANGSGDYQTAEVNWFADVLEEAYDLGYAVVCAEHFGFDPSVCTGVHCTFNSDENIENEGSWTIPSGYIGAVETFIGGGGTFICWLGGHVHKDRLTIHNNGHQWFVGVSTASHETHQISFEDSNRIYGDKSQDSFNIVGIDTYKKRLTILKIGSDLTRMLAHKRYLCLDYENRTVLYNN